MLQQQMILFIYFSSRFICSFFPNLQLMKPAVAVIYTGGDQEVPLNVIHVKIHASCKRIEDKALFRRKKLEKIDFAEADGLEEIGEGACEGCESLKHFEAPQTLMKIGKRAFAACIRMRSPKLNEGLEEIGVEAFWKCRSIKYLFIPSTVEKLFSCAFENKCRQLEEILIAVEVNYTAKQKSRIYKGTFEDCNKVKLMMKPEKLELSDGAVSKTASIEIKPITDQEASRGVCQKLEKEITKK